MSCVAAPATCRPLPSIPLGSAPCYSPLCLMPPQQSNNALSLQPIHRQHVAYTSHYGRGCFSDFVLDPNMTHCLLSAAVGSNCEDTAPAKPESPWSSPSLLFNLPDRSYIEADTGFPLFGRYPQQRGVPVVWSNHPPRNNLHFRIVLPLQGTCCWYAEADALSVWPNRCCRSALTGHVGWDELGRQ